MRISKIVIVLIVFVGICISVLLLDVLREKARVENDLDKILVNKGFSGYVIDGTCNDRRSNDFISWLYYYFGIDFSKYGSNITFNGKKYYCYIEKTLDWQIVEKRS